MYRVACFLFVLITSLTASAQTSASTVKESGIYLTEQDFLNNTLSLFSKDDADNHLDVVLGDVTLTRNGKTSKLKKGSFFGYYQDGVRYRYYRNGLRVFPSKAYYKILEDSGVVIYSRVATAYKRSPRTWYYYSENVSSPVKKISGNSISELSERIQVRLKKYIDPSRSES